MAQLDSVGVPPIEAALVDAFRALSSRLDVGSVAHTLLDAVHDVFGASSAWVLLQDPRQHRLRTVAWRGPRGDAFRDVEMPVNAGIMGLAFSSRQVVFIPDAQADARWFNAPRVHRTGMRSVLAVPLVCEGRARGVVGLDAAGFTGARPPAGADRTRLEALAAQAAVAFANAEAYEACERDRRRLAALLEERRGLQRRVASLQQEVRAAHDVAAPVGTSRPWRDAVQMADIVAEADTTVLLQGETGTGKELIARRIHERSARASRPFVAVNCAALPETLVESELFGHEKGAFTNALARKPGRFELADGGTLFLDEVGDLPVGAQAKLLRVLQESRVERLGGTSSVPLDVRLIAATNKDLETAMAAGEFRSDLYFRLSVFPVSLPALRERQADIPGLARHFVRAFARRFGRPADDISDEALQRLVNYAWPGNVRELQNVMERAALLSRTARVSSEVIWLPRPRLGVTRERVPGVTTLAEADRRAILAALDVAGWRVSGAGGAADRLGTKPTTLHAKMKKLGIRRPPKPDVIAARSRLA